MGEVVHQLEQAIASDLSGNKSVGVILWENLLHWHDHEWVQDGENEGPWEHCSSPVLGVSVMDTVHNKMASDCVLVVWHPVPLAVENKPVKSMLKESPEYESSHEG